MNYFELFDVPAQFEVDLVLLARHYQTLQQLTHPDKFATASDSQKRVAMQKNAQVNDGYSVLKNPLQRAEHLLGLRGFELAPEQQTLRDTQFLMLQMEWREELEELVATKNLDALAQFEQQITRYQQQQMQQLQHWLDTDTAEANEQAAAQIARLKFLVKLRAQIEQRQDELEEDL